MSTEKSTIYSQDGGGIMPLRPSDLVFNKTPDGIVSCGYMVKNAMLNSTLNHQFQSGGGGGGGKTKLIYGNDAKLNVNKSKIMEDLVVPSSLYYCRPIYKHKVFHFFQLSQPDLPSQTFLFSKSNRTSQNCFLFLRNRIHASYLLRL